MKISRVAWVAVSLGVIGASPAFASDEFATDESQTVDVRFHDLDLAKNKDAKVLFMRLRDAAEDVCGTTYDAASLFTRLQVEQCQKEAIGGAVEKINQPLLTAVYDKHFERRGQS
jgi:UrcA family protein